MSDNPSIRDYRITKANFRSCSTYGSRSQAHFYLYALRLIADQAECTFALLRYSLGGDRPSQTAQLTLSAARIHGISVRTKACSGWYFKDGSTVPKSTASKPPTYPTHDMPDINTRL